MCPLTMDSFSKTIVHGIGYILVFEYSYFCSHVEGPKDIFALAVKEYQDSGIQVTVVKALEQAIQEHDNNYPKLELAIVDIILTNRMSNKFKLVNLSTSQS
ncbi:hypothetical protein V8B97DRAFT_1948294 [Scleroderma yunnanense]